MGLFVFSQAVGSGHCGPFSLFSGFHCSGWWPEHDLCPQHLPRGHSTPFLEDGHSAQSQSLTARDAQAAVLRGGTRTRLLLDLSRVGPTLLHAIVQSCWQGARGFSFPRFPLFLSAPRGCL